MNFVSRDKETKGYTTSLNPLKLVFEIKVGSVVSSRLTLSHPANRSCKKSLTLSIYEFEEVKN